MGDFEKSLSFTFGSEGGVSNHPADRGGLTSMGITASTLSRAYKQKIVKHNDVRRLSRDEAALIYRKLYWEPSHAGEMPWPLCALHFDAAVNHGVGGAVRLLQRTLNKVGGSALAVDGSIGPVTQKALSGELLKMEVNAAYLNKFCAAYLDNREALLKAIVAKNPSQKVFLRGWINRIEKNRKLV